MRNEKLIITQDWENTEGALVMQNATTINRYNELTEAMRNYSDPCIFFAFDQSQYDEKAAIARKHMKEGEKILRGKFGMFATQSAYDKMKAFNRECYAKIAEECDPQEVYCYEWNNHECRYNWEGDAEPYEIVCRIFGEEACKGLRRWRNVE